ncbi:MAG: 50S ribosomal protein L32 [Bacillota bacterium]
MAEPKKRLTRTRSGNRQSHDSISPISLISCPKCKAKIIPHRICKNCGYYKGLKIIKNRDEKKEESRKKKELKDE